MPEDPTGDESAEQEANRRDAAAYRRDRAAEQRDEVAAGRDDAAVLRDAAAGDTEPTVGSVVTEQTMADATAERGLAASDRDHSRGDRAAAAAGRMDSERDRVSAQLDRGESGPALDDSDIDAVTGAHLRRPGLEALDHDVARARRAGDRYVVALIRIDGPGLVGVDRDGTGADELLEKAAAVLRAVAPGDQLLVRYSGEVLLNGLPGLTLAGATERVTGVTAALTATTGHVSVTTGYAELRADDSVWDVIVRAETELRGHR